MGDVVNLRQARKAKARTEKQKLADANRALFGRSKAEKTKQLAERDQLAKLVDGHKRGGDPAT